MKKRLVVPNSILFLFDNRHPSVIIPDYVDDNIIAFNSTCVSLGTQAEVDGEVSIELIPDRYFANISQLKQVFSGIIETPGFGVCISSSEDECILNTKVNKGNTEVSIWVDDLSFPGEVVFVIR